MGVVIILCVTAGCMNSETDEWINESNYSGVPLWTTVTPPPPVPPHEGDKSSEPENPNGVEEIYQLSLSYSFKGTHTSDCVDWSGERETKIYETETATIEINAPVKLYRKFDVFSKYNPVTISGSKQSLPAAIRYSMQTNEQTYQEGELVGESHESLSGNVDSAEVLIGLYPEKPLEDCSVGGRGDGATFIHVTALVPVTKETNIREKECKPGSVISPCPKVWRDDNYNMQTGQYVFAECYYCRPIKDPIVTTESTFKVTDSGYSLKCTGVSDWDYRPTEDSPACGKMKREGIFTASLIPIP